MLRPEPPVIEYQGAEWSFRYDLRALPTYIHLTTRGQATERRNQRLVEVIRHHLRYTTDKAGQIYPLINDLRGEATSASAMEAGQLLQSEFSALLRYMVLLLADRHCGNASLESFLDTRAWGSAQDQVAIAFTLEEAIAQVQAHHTRQQGE